MENAYIQYLYINIIIMIYSFGSRFFYGRLTTVHLKIKVVIPDWKDFRSFVELVSVCC